MNIRYKRNVSAFFNIHQGRGSPSVRHGDPYDLSPALRRAVYFGNSLFDLVRRRIYHGLDRDWIISSYGDPANFNYMR